VAKERVTLRRLEQLLVDAAELLGKMDVAAKRNYVFALLLLKRCSDAFDEARERVYAAELARTGSEHEAAEIADDPDEYTTHVFVPEVSGWAGLATVHRLVGNRLNDALKGLETYNADLAGALGHIDFNRAPGGERPDDPTLVALVRMLSGVSLRDEDLEFPDLIGSVYESVLRRFADTAGTSSGDLYTPRPVVRLMVGLADPGPGDTVYDPCAGSAGMLILAREYVADHHPGQGGMVALAGQDVSTAQWVAARMNLLLHGIRDADVRLGDTLTEPRHIIDGRPRRFTRIISNPEFSAEYDATATQAHAYGRFRYGAGVRAADLMFVQHMVASLADGGLAVTVMPHGVLFRAGKEGEIRQALLRADIIEAVIGLGAGIFSGTGIPACLLVLRAPGGKTAKTRGTVLFINADREYTPGRTQNHLGEEHIEKITRVYREWRDVDGFSRCVPVAELLADDANLNIRRWVDNTPPPEPQDVGAHLYGGVPRSELAALRPAFSGFALDVDDFFRPLDDDYAAFPPEGPQAVAERISAAAAETETGVRTTFATWWTEHGALLAELSTTGTPMAVRERLLTTFRAALGDYSMLDEFALTGLIAQWWGDHLEDIKALAAGGPSRLVQGWAASVEAMFAPHPGKGGKPKARSAAERREARAHPLVGRLLPDMLRALELLEAEHAALDAAIKAASVDRADDQDGPEISETELARLKKDRTKAKRALDELVRSFPEIVVRSAAGLSTDRAEHIVLDILRDDLLTRLDAKLDQARRAVVRRYQMLAEKYEVSLADLERQRNAAAARLAGYLDELGYRRRDTPGIS
jgi:type I restriction enzyme M protein